jgi:hypothetical protein
MCPASAPLDNVTIAGPNATTEIVAGVYQNNASVKTSGMQLKNVASNTGGDHQTQIPSKFAELSSRQPDGLRN